MFQLYCRGQQLSAVCEPRCWWHFARVVGGYGLYSCSWFLFAAFWVVMGSYFQSQRAPVQMAELANPNYVLSQEHYLYKKIPLPAVVETEEETDEQNEADEESVVDRQNPAPEDATDHADLKARVKQAMAEIEQ